MPYAKPYAERTERAKQLHRERVREWKRRNRVKVRVQKRRWNRRKSGLEPRLTNEEYIRKTFGPKPSKEEEIHRQRVRRTARNEVRTVCCEVCGSTENLERHHEDYSKPSDVKVLCTSCHKKLHHKTLVVVPSLKCP
jgi:hypothetical protein